jgi:phosphatidylglycerol:prolipoprotein diacylglycerol transferase
MLVLPFPAIDPVAVSIGPFVVRWYALAYVFGFLCCWLYASALIRNDRLWGDTPHPTPESLLDLVLYAMLGTVIGGRLGQVARLLDRRGHAECRAIVRGMLARW